MADTPTIAKSKLAIVNLAIDPIGKLAIAKSIDGQIGKLDRLTNWQIANRGSIDKLSITHRD